MEFNDAIQEGDAHRILRCWRIFLPVLKASVTIRSKAPPPAAPMIVNTIVSGMRGI